ncbi:MAG: M20/M25/M40 family metallo-hydrolase [Polyangiaceae bacterium]|nr:M20/M25/M40 family metallo-hydrolase [Polyangiaceae bacterium]
MSDTVGSNRMTADEEIAWARAFISRVVEEAPRRMATSADERRAQEITREEMEKCGLVTEFRPFRWNRSLYANLALHFGLGALGSLAAVKSPALGLALHGAALVSFAADTSRKAFLLRRLFPFAESQNLVGRVPSKEAPRLRIVFLAHADAAFTGLLFQPEFVKRVASKPGSPLYKSLRIATLALLGLCAIDGLELATGKSTALQVARGVLTLPSFLAGALNLDVVVRNQIVPGAADDLSGVAGLLLLARRLAGRVPDDVELVYVATGCEESGLGGAQALADQMRGEWSPDNTVIVGMDGLANGDLSYYEEGEVFPVPIPEWLRGALEKAAASDADLASVRGFNIPVGGTDAVPFAVAGYPAVTIGCVDLKMGIPRHYHVPTDTPENLEADQIPRSLTMVERLVGEIISDRTGQALHLQP